MTANSNAMKVSLELEPSAPYSFCILTNVALHVTSIKVRKEFNVNRKLIHRHANSLVGDVPLLVMIVVSESFQTKALLVIRILSPLFSPWLTYNRL